MDACPNKFIRREETFGSNLSLTCFGKIQLAEEKRLRNPNDVYAEQRRKALAKKHKKIEDDGEDPSEGVEPYKLRLNLPFFYLGAQPRPFFNNANRFREFGYRSLRAQSLLAGSNSRGSTT
jgi:hypothetical protein